MTQFCSETGFLKLSQVVEITVIGDLFTVLELDWTSSFQPNLHVNRAFRIFLCKTSQRPLWIQASALTYKTPRLVKVKHRTNGIPLFTKVSHCDILSCHSIPHPNMPELDAAPGGWVRSCTVPGFDLAKKKVDCDTEHCSYTAQVLMASASSESSLSLLEWSFLHLWRMPTPKAGNIFCSPVSWRKSANSFSASCEEVKLMIPSWTFGLT